MTLRKPKLLVLSSWFHKENKLLNSKKLIGLLSMYDMYETCLLSDNFLIEKYNTKIGREDK